ncbi:MAG: S8 family serine peptidase [Chloroflexota bacterium]
MKRFSIGIGFSFLLLGLMIVLFGSAVAQSQGSEDEGAETAVSPANNTTNLANLPDESWRERAAEKMDAELLQQLQSQPADEPLTAIVKLAEQADLSAASQIQSRTARRTFVYQRLRHFAQQNQQAILADVNQLGRRQGEAVVVQPFFIINGFALTSTPELIWELARREDVALLTADHVLTLHTSEMPSLDAIANSLHVQKDSISIDVTSALIPGENIAQIRADEVWETYGLTGSGVLVGSIDSGVSYLHPALVAQYAGNLGNGAFEHDFHWYDPLNEFGSPYDDNGHGTHTMGTAVGGDGLGPFADDIGVAPGAKWITVKAFDAGGFSSTAALHQAFEWILAPCPVGVAPGDASCDPSRAPDVLNNSWGNSNGTNLTFVDAVANLRMAGIWPVFSAGNSGPGPGSLGAPASFETAFAVGAVNSNDVVAGFSSRGPSFLTDELKPDVSAPGVAVLSAWPHGGYEAASGTSMAAPHVVGLGALLLEAEPALDLDTIERLVRAATVDLGASGPDFDYGQGRIDAFAAVNRLLDAGDLQGTVRDSASLTPLAGVEVYLVGQGLVETAVTDANGNYNISFLIAGDYTLTIDYYGYEPQTLTNVNVLAQQTVTQDINLVALPRHTVSGFVTHALTPTIAIEGASITALDTPLAPATTDANGFYTLEVAEGDVRLEAAAFGFATAVSAQTITSAATVDFSLAPLPPVLLVDDDEGRTKTYSPHVEDYYFTMLDAGGYNYDYWDIELEGPPSFDTMRQYPAVVWFGGEFGRIKDISDMAQAEAMMAYLDIGGSFFYIAQSHTFYFGNDNVCDSERWGGEGPCPLTQQYLGIEDWIEDQKADEAVGAAGNPVGDGLGPYPMTYPPLVADFTDMITGTAEADLAFIGLDDVPEGQMNLTSYTVVSPTADFQVVYMATPLEAFPAAGAADVMQRVLDWFGVNGLADGPSFVPGNQTERAVPGETITFNLRVKNFSDTPDTYTLLLENDAWPTTIWNGTQTAVISEVGPIPPQGTVDLVITVDVPLGAQSGAEQPITIRAESQGETIFISEALLRAQAKMDYYMRDSDQCNGGIHMEWVDATVGDRWDLGGDGPVAQQVPLPEPFLFYNESYESLWFNVYGTVLFGEENLIDDLSASGDPPIPNPTLLDPNRAIYAAWGNFYWFPNDQLDPNAAIYTHHETTNGRNWFVIEYHLYNNFLGEEDTFEVILDLDSNEIIMQYLTMTDATLATVGIENEIGTEGILYVDDQVPAENTLHDGLVIHYGVGDPPDVWEAILEPETTFATGQPNGRADYLLTLHNNSTLADEYVFEVGGSNWPVTFWDATFKEQIETIGAIPPCGSAQFGVRVELPPDTDYVQNTAVVRARSQGDTLLAAAATLTTDNAAPAFDAPAELFGSGPSRETVTIHVPIQNTGNITDSYQLSLAGGSWLSSVAPETTIEVPPSGMTTAVITVDIPATAAAGETDLSLLSITSANYPGTDGVINVTTQATPKIGLAWDEREQAADGPEDWTIRYVLTARNLGNLVDRFTLSALGDEWSTTFWNDSFTSQIDLTEPLGPDETQRIGVQVRIPKGAAPPQQDAMLAVATSTLDSSQQTRALLTTSVMSPPPAEFGVAILPAAQWQQGGIGATRSYVLEVHNMGTEVDSYSLSLSGNEWSTTIEPSEISGVPAGEKVFVTVEVMIPEEAALYDEVTVLVQSVGETAVSDQANLITVQGTAVFSTKLFLPFIR